MAPGRPQDGPRKARKAPALRRACGHEVALKRMVLQLERKVKTNQEQRIKFADEPDARQ